VPYHTPLSLHQKISNKWLPLVFIISIFCCSSVKAQFNNSDSNYGISIGTDYDTPIGNLGYTFKPALNYNVNLFKHSGDFTASVSIGYHVYKPKQDTFYYAATATDFGTAVYQNFTVVSFYLGGTYDYPVTDQFKIYGGVNLGLYNTHLAFHSVDFLVDDTEDLHEQDLYFAPRLGFTYMFDDNVGIGLEGKYNFFAPTGKKQFDDRIGTLYNSWSAGIRLTYNF